MTAAIAFPRTTASTFLTHLFGSGLADDRYVVERFKALADGDIRRCAGEEPAPTKNLGDRRDAFETMRDAAADAYRAETGDTWRPRRGSHTSQTGHLTSAAIDARDFMRARKDRETRAHLPEGTLVAITGGKEVRDPSAIFARLDKTKAKYDDMVR